MSSVMENGAAVFTSQPQVVEVYQAGVWLAGELLGWRHDDTGACQVWVRTVVAGAEETAWTDLATLRLPEPASAFPTASTVVATQVMPVVRGAGPARDLDTTAGLPLKRDHLRRPAPDRPGGRRRAPEGGDVQVSRASSVRAPAPGRHRAPGGEADGAAGRHRAADTGMFPVVGSATEVPVAPREGFHEIAAWSAPSARPAPALDTASVGRGWTPPADLDADLLTRPMRLGDQAPHSRRPRLNGFIGGV